MGGAAATEELTLGPQSISEGMLQYMELDELQTLYEGAIRHVPHTGRLETVHSEMQELLGLAADHARADVEAVGIDVGAAEARYVPSLSGARYDDEADALEVGGPGVMDRPYYLETELSHELLHHHVREAHGVEEYTPEEEGVMQVWSCYHADVIDDEAERERWVDAARAAYNEHGGFPDGFGDTLYEQAQETLKQYDNAPGSREDRIGVALRDAFATLDKG